MAFNKKTVEALTKAYILPNAKSPCPTIFDEIIQIRKDEKGRLTVYVKPFESVIFHRRVP